MSAERLRQDLVTKIESFPESGMLFWRVTVVLKDGSQVQDVLCEHDGTQFTFLTPRGNLKSDEIVDVTWEGRGRPTWIQSA